MWLTFYRCSHFEKVCGLQFTCIVIHKNNSILISNDLLPTAWELHSISSPIHNFHTDQTYGQSHPPTLRSTTPSVLSWCCLVVHSIAQQPQELFASLGTSSKQLPAAVKCRWRIIFYKELDWPLAWIPSNTSKPMSTNV